jgi:hypothetical protein
MLLATQLFRGFEDTLLHRMPGAPGDYAAELALLMGLLIVISFAFVNWAENRFFNKKNKLWPVRPGLTVYALLILAAAFEISFQLEHFLLMAGQFPAVLGRQVNSDWFLFGASASAWAIKSIQVFIIMIGMKASLAVFRKHILTHTNRSASSLSSLYLVPVVLPGVLFLFAFLFS